MIVFFAVVMSFLGAMGAYFFKKAATRTARLIALFACREFYFGALFYAIGLILNIWLMEYIQYSILYPMSAVTYIWTAVISCKLLGEQMSRKKLAGLIAIVIGVIFISA